MYTINNNNKCSSGYRCQVCLCDSQVCLRDSKLAIRGDAESPHLPLPCFNGQGVQDAVPGFQANSSQAGCPSDLYHSTSQSVSIYQILAKQGSLACYTLWADSLPQARTGDLTGSSGPETAPVTPEPVTFWFAGHLIWLQLVVLVTATAALGPYMVPAVLVTVTVLICTDQLLILV